MHHHRVVNERWAAYQIEWSHQETLCIKSPLRVGGQPASGDWSRLMYLACLTTCSNKSNGEVSFMYKNEFIENKNCSYNMVVWIGQIIISSAWTPAERSAHVDVTLLSPTQRVSSQKASKGMEENCSSGIPHQQQQQQQLLLLLIWDPRGTIFR